MSSEPAWFRFYPAEYLLDSKVDSLSLEAQGILVRLWCVCARDGFLPSDLEEIARKALVPLDRLVINKRLLGDYFSRTEEDGEVRYFSTRLSKELKDYKRKQKAQSLAAQATNAKRWEGPNREVNRLAMASDTAKRHAKRLQKVIAIQNSEVITTPPTPSPGVEPLGLTEVPTIAKRSTRGSPKEKPSAPSVNDLLGGKDTPVAAAFWKAVGAWAKNRTQRLKDAAVLWRQIVDGGISSEALLVAVQRCMGNFSQDEVSTGKVIRFDTWLEQEGFRTWLPRESPPAAQPKTAEEEMESSLYRKYLESNAMLRGVSFPAFKASQTAGVAP